MIRVGQIRTDPNDGEVIQILSVKPIEFKIIRGYNVGIKYGRGFSLADILEYWSEITESEKVLNILTHYESKSESKG